MRFRKLLFGVLAISLFAAPMGATASSFDGKIPSKTLLSIEFELPEFFKSWLQRGLTDDHKNDVEMQKLLSGMRFLYARPLENFSGSYDGYSNSFQAFGATEEEFQTLKKEFEEGFSKLNPEKTFDWRFQEKSYKGQTYWQSLYEGFTLMHDGQHAWIILSPGGIEPLIDALQGNSPSLLQNPRYAKMKSVLPWDTAVLSFFYDLQAWIKKEATKGAEFSPTSAEYALLSDIFQSLGSTFLKTSYGYEWKIKIDQSQEALAKNGLELTPGGFFTPSLYRKFPNAPVIAYLESNNWKGRMEAWKKFLAAFIAAEKPATDTETNPTVQAEEIFTNLFSEFNKDYGIDIQPLLQALQGKIAFALQDTGFELPVFTAMADVSSDVPVAEKFAEDLGAFIENGFNGKVIHDLVSRSTVRIGGKDFSRFHINYTYTTAWEGPHDFPSMDITVGVTNEGLLVISTDPAITTHFGQGLQNNTAFASAYQNRDTPVLGITYLGLRNAWNFMDRFIDWRMASNERGLVDWRVAYRRDQEHSIPFSFIRHYLKILEDVYFARDIFIEKNVEEDMLTWTAKIFTDHVAHETWKHWKMRLSSQDADADGLDDYSERFVYFTDPDSRDSDGDSVSDGEEIRAGSDPYGVQTFLRDMPESAWYRKAVSNLFARGAIEGYWDKTFRPGKIITRAEFVCMASRALDMKPEKFAGTGELEKWFSSYDYVPPLYNDVHYENWYSPCVQEALDRGLIMHYESYFRPHDPITRAEATAIIIRMDEMLAKKVQDLRWSLEKPLDLPFTDVPKNAWFYFYVRVAYLESLVAGRTPTSFAPLKNMTRAEAAVMLQNGLTRRMHILETSEGSPLDDKLDDAFFEIMTSNF